MSNHRLYSKTLLGKTMLDIWDWDIIVQVQGSAVWYLVLVCDAMLDTHYCCVGMATEIF